MMSLLEKKRSGWAHAHDKHTPSVLSLSLTHTHTHTHTGRVVTWCHTGGPRTPFRTTPPGACLLAHHSLSQQTTHTPHTHTHTHTHTRVYARVCHPPPHRVCHPPPHRAGRQAGRPASNERERKGEETKKKKQKRRNEEETTRWGAPATTLAPRARRAEGRRREHAW